MIIFIYDLQIKLMPQHIAFGCFNLDKKCRHFTISRKFLD